MFPLPPETEKNCCRIMVVSSRGILSEQRQKSSKNFVKSYEKSQFSIEILIKKSQNFLKIFQNFGLFWSKRAKFCMHVSGFSLSNGNYSLNVDYIVFSINYSQFSPKVLRIFTPLPIFLLDLSHFEFFDKFLN